ncbi:carbohydrate ABC transporter membrane protein 2, CUT1 family (TC 3.A.1.1.-) [Butyrivibrio fibrisolvens DSM 3071]|uniref:Carbohydrate ABC transporter membrane protein 2, CUT1 family (TC 3.A.1.1.-) n=1 Tax=Butyrivibrio fibrisolvens DSM 3071 TaxID=1121131 RepID=A0A1M5V2J3_BUTFI|nr:ABC transporter permease subunit [Butyrivibrio fibrisolvens]SHH69318.1 carbohydrate ABC transporter membrane protein 2, CUT1 family (TC 3.A.1.1.-) [Butyrivibrio fibrisolvens DSM 3071]
MKKTIRIILRHLFLAFLSFVWLIPIVWLFVTSLSAYKGINTMHFFPSEWSLDNYVQLFTRPDTLANFPAWFKNSFIIGVFTCIISSTFVLMVSYAFSCMRFAGRKQLMSLYIILGMFPGVLSMIATYFVMKMLGLTNSIVGLIIIYSAGSGLGYLICKGFFDTIPLSLRESAKLEGASEYTIFTRIVIPLSKPIIVYTVINAFLAPWVDFVMARLMIRSKDPVNWTVAMGLFNLVQRTLVGDYFSVFCAGGIIVAIPISVLFLIMQRFYVEGITGGAVKG